MAEKEIIDAGVAGPEDSPAGGHFTDTESPAAQKLAGFADLQGTPKGETPTPEPAPAAEDSPDSVDMDVFESEADWLKAKGLEGYESFDAYVQATQQPFNQLKQIMESYGFKTEAKDLAELNQQLVEELVKTGTGSPAPNAPANQPAPNQPDTQALDLDGFFKRYGDQIDDGTKKFYSDLANTLAQHAQKPAAEVQSRLQVLQDVSELMLVRDWYNDAKSQAGEDAIPTFAEAKAMLSNSPQVRDSALFRLMRFGDTSANPMSQIFNLWRAGKVTGGITKAEAAKREASAKKIAIMKGMLKATPATKPTGKPRSLEETAAYLDSLKLSDLK